MLLHSTCGSRSRLACSSIIPPLQPFSPIVSTPTMTSLLEGYLPSSGDNSTIPGIPVPPVDRQSCSLLGDTGLIVQGLMAVLVLGSLLVKRFKEHPPRTWPVWLADVSKQIIGQGFLHSTNVLISTLVSHHGNQDACSAYFLSILVDCTLGVLVIFATLKLFSYILITRMHLPGFRTGQYYPVLAERAAVAPEAPEEEEGDDPASTEPRKQQPQQSLSPSSTTFQMSWWGRQLCVYLITLCIMKLAIIGFFWIPAVFAFGDWILSWLGEDTKVVFVLMIFPLIMNAFQVRRLQCIFQDDDVSTEGDEHRLTCPTCPCPQFLVIDAILKSSQHKPPTGQSPAGAKADTATDDREDEQRDRLRRGGAAGRRDSLAHEDTDDENQAFLSQADRDADTTLPTYQSSQQALQSGDETLSPVLRTLVKAHTESSQTGRYLRTNESTSDALALPLEEKSISSGDEKQIRRTRISVSTPSIADTRGPRTNAGPVLPLHTMVVSARPAGRSPSPQQVHEKMGSESERDDAGWDWLDEEPDFVDAESSKREIGGATRERRLSEISAV